MDRTFLLLTISASLALAACQTSHYPSKPISKIEARTIDQETIKQRALAQLGDILVSQPNPPWKGRPRNSLKDLWFWTKPYSTEVDGLCQADLVTLTFAPDNVEPADAETPSRVRGVRASPHFYFLKPPKNESYVIRTPEQAERDDDACRRLNPRTTDFIASENADYLNDNAVLFNLMTEKLKLSAPGFEIGCRFEKGCMEALKSFELGDVKEVSRCQRLDDPGNVTCARFELDKDGRFRLEIIGPYKDRNPISRVTLSEVIVLAHERID